LEWGLTMRITNPAARVGTAVIIALVVMPLSGWPVYVAESMPANEVTVDTGLISAVLFLVLTLAGVVFCTRTFRGASEDSDRSRAWWRMTEGAIGGLFLGAMFLVIFVAFAFSLHESISYARQFGDPDWASLAWQQSIYVATFLIVGVAFSASAVRLIMEERRARRALPLAA
jgi:membrane protease YdiL (CAAX protease family)